MVNSCFVANASNFYGEENYLTRELLLFYEISFVE